MRTRGAVIAVGAQTSIGLDAPTSAFSYRATLAGMKTSPLLDLAGEPATLCHLPTLDPLLVGAERLVALGLPALEEALATVGERASTMRARMTLCLHESFASDRVGARQVVDPLVRAASAACPELDVSTSVRGTAGFGFALTEALGELEGGRRDLAIVGGVHSDYDPARIQALDEAGRLFTGDRLDAVIPGEGAAFAIVARPDRARTDRIPVRARIHALETGQAKTRIDNDESAFEAGALTAITRAAGAPLTEGGLRAGWFLTDLSFERWRLYELQAAMTRTQHLWCEPQYLDAPAQRLGVLGAATVPMHLALACEGWRRGWAPHRYAMSFSGSDTGERAAMLLGAP